MAVNAQRVALVTGGSRGIGFAIARELRRVGWRVAITSRSLERAEDAASQLLHAHADGSGSADGDDQGVLPLAYVAPQELGTTSEDEAVRVVRDVTQRWGPVTTLVNAAGISQDSLLLRLKRDVLEQQLLTNLVGPIQMTKAVTKSMMAQRKGSIINIGSVVGSSGNTGQTAYSASKAGLIGVTRSLAKELGSRNIRVNLVEPGFIETDMTATMADEAQQRVRSNVSLGRLGSADEVAALVAFLAGDSASYITGQCIRVDGGLAL